MECKQGCNGTAIFECNQCRSYKLRLDDVRQIVESMWLEKQQQQQQQQNSASSSSSVKKPKGPQQAIDTIGGVDEVKPSYNQRQIDMASSLLNDMMPTMLASHQVTQDPSSSSHKTTSSEGLYKLVQSYQDFYLKKEFWSDASVEREDVEFCVSECPAQMPYYTSDFYCSKDMPIK